MGGTKSYSGAVDGGVRRLLRVEGLVLFICAVALYWRAGGSWVMFAALILTPDLSFLAYAAGPRLGAAAYNAMHATIAPLLLGAGGAAIGQPLALMLALVWLAHIGFDRALGYGLKHAQGFGFTHLGRIGRSARGS